jgi:hypothetical protein
MADGIAVVALVRQHGAGIAIALLHQPVVCRLVMGFALAEYDPDGETCGVATHVDLGAEPTARTAECLILLLSVFSRGAAMRSHDGAVDHLHHVQCAAAVSQRLKQEVQCVVIWDFVQNEIDRRSLVGWGYQSSWLVPGSPALSEAPGWVKLMPNAHNGYYDTTLEMGHIGLTLLLVFILATLHAIGRVADRDPARAWLLLSLALFIIYYNYFESLWMRGFEFLRVMFIFVAVDIDRYLQPVPLRRAAYRSRSPKPGGPGPLPSVQAHRLRARLS